MSCRKVSECVIVFSANSAIFQLSFVKNLGIFFDRKPHRWRSGWRALTKDYEFGICCFSAKHAAIRRKSKDCMVVRNQKIVSEWSDMSIRRLLFQCFGLEQSGPHHHHLIEN
jgi:hypothetical protein